MIKEHLPNLIKNVAVKNLFDIRAEEQKQLLISTLTRIVPFNPRLANKLYSLSNFGLQEKYLSKFSGARSIQQATITAWNNEAEVVSSVRVVEEANSSSLQARSAGSNLRHLYLAHPKCMTDMAQQMRDTMWEMNMEGITMPSQQEQTKLYRWVDVPLAWASRAILVMVDASVGYNPLITRGRHTPYYGSATKMRVRRAPMQVLEVGNIVSSLKQLMEIKGWVKGNDEITRLIETLIREKTTVPTEALEMFTRQVYSGAISHRLPCQALKRGGMTNQNLNFSSHVRILSDTALHYAKSGTNYTICFQAAFLYAISTLAQYQEAGLDIVGKWGLVFHKPCCVKEIPTEQFSLDHSDYAGVDLQNKIHILRPKYEVARTLQDSVVDGITSYSVIMARKFTVWIRNIELTTRISTLENRAVHESLTAPFVNLTEFVHLNCRQFFDSFIYYNYLYSRDTRVNPHSLWEPLLTSSPLKSAYDVLCDSMIKCNLLRPWMEITGRKMSSGSTREGLRGLLVHTLSKVCLPGWKHIVINNTILTHEDTEAIYIAASRLLHQARSAYWPYAMTTSYTQIRDTLMQEDSPELIPSCTTSEEEAVCMVRAAERPSHHSLRPADRYPIVEARGYATGKYSSLLNDIAGCMGFTRASTSLYLLLTMSEVTGWSEWLSHKSTYLYTFDDREGALYTFLSHLITGLWSKRVKGHPTWSIEDDEIELVINEGPVCVAMDPCKLSYDMLRFQSSMTGRPLYKAHPTASLYVLHQRCASLESNYAWKCVPLGGLVVMEHDSRRTFPPMCVYHVIRTIVRPGYTSIWLIGRKQDKFSYANLGTRVQGSVCNAGFCSAREAMAFVRASVEQVVGCYSLTTWVQARLSITNLNREDLMRITEAEYISSYKAMVSMSVNQPAQDVSEGVRSIYKTLTYWAWVLMCGAQEPETVARSFWRTEAHLATRHAQYNICHCDRKGCGIMRADPSLVSRIKQEQWMWYAVWRKVGPVEERVTDINVIRITLHDREDPEEPGV